MSDQPNILLVIADQLAPHLTGAYGHPVVQTPHLSELAAQGSCFDAAYSPCPVCAPARAAMMTGRYVSNIGVYDNAASFSCEEPTLAHYLTLAGYDSVLSGKMHFIGPDQLHGFQRRFTTNVYPAEFDWVPVRGVDHPSERSHALQYLGDSVHVGRWSDFLSGDEETHFRALEYLHAKAIARDTEGDRQPFFLTVSYHHPHEPFWPPRAFWDLYEEAEIAVPEYPPGFEAGWSTLDRWLNSYHGISNAPGLRDPESIRRVRRAYYALVSYVDHKLGQLLGSLEDNGFADNTVVVFTSDHGDMLCEKGMVQKRTFYESSSRVPLIVKLPGQAQAARRIALPVNLIDLLPTLLDLAGYPREDRLPLDGFSLFSEDRPAYTFSEYHAQGSHAPCFMLREGRFKYIYIHGHEDQLFDLDADPGEWRNLSADTAYRAQVDAMRGRILKQFDPDAIDRAVSLSVRRRWLLKDAMQINGIRWDAEPCFDPKRPVHRQYLR